MKKCLAINVLWEIKWELHTWYKHQSEFVCYWICQKELLFKQMPSASDGILSFDLSKLESRG